MSIVPSTGKVPAGLVAIFLGGLGIHKFLIGATNAGVVMLAVTIAGWIFNPFGLGHLAASLMSVIGLVKGIIYLTRTDSEFYSQYQVGHKPWF